METEIRTAQNDTHFWQAMYEVEYEKRMADQKRRSEAFKAQMRRRNRELVEIVEADRKRREKAKERLLEGIVWLLVVCVIVQWIMIGFR